MSNVFPAYLTNQSPLLFLLHSFFVGSIFLGQYFLCLWVQKRKTLFSNVLLESFLFVPFFLFPLAFFFSWLKLGNIFYGLIQAVFISFALFGIARYRKHFNLHCLRSISLAEWLCYGVIFVVGYFGWLVPIPENYNGHGHVLWNVLTRMLHTGSFDFLGKSSLSSDDIIQLFFPPHFTFLLRFYCLEYPLFFYRPAFLVSILVGFLLVQMVKDICKAFNFPKSVGLLGFLGIIGTFFNSTILFDMQYDVFSLLMLLYFTYLLAKLILKGESVFSSILVLLFFAYLIRTQIFIILFFALSLMFVTCFRRLKDLLVIKPVFVLPGFFALLIWIAMSWVKYDHPMWPQSRGIVERVVIAINPRYQKQKTVNIEELPLVTKQDKSQMEKGSEKYGERVQYFLSFFHHYLPEGGVFPLFLFSIRAGPFSLALTFIFLILFLSKKIKFFGREFFIIEGLLLFGWIAEYILFYIGHNKFPQYLSAVTLLPAGHVLCFIEKRFKKMVLLLAVALFLNFNILLFGHGSVNFSFFPSQILLGQKTFVEKLAYKSNKSVSETKAEVEELHRAYNSGKRILHMEVEPGGLLPSLMGREFFGNAFYFSPINEPLKDVMTAKNKEAFTQSLEKRNIGFIFIPQRDHGSLEFHPLFQALRDFERKAQHHLLVPVDEVVKNIQYPL